MALIGTIRKNGWILIVFMVLALGGFILMDIVSNSSRYSQGDVNSLGKVNGKEIKRSEFDTYEKLVYSNAGSSAFQVREQVWNYFVESELVKDEAEKMGLGVSKDELLDLQFGDYLSPIIMQRFGQGGQPDRAQLANIRSAIEGGTFTDPNNRAYWAVQEKEVVKDRLENKIVNMATKALYVPSWQAEMNFRESNDKVDYLSVRVPYDKVNDADAVPTDADYEAFLKDNGKLYEQTEESRILSYTSFDVVPTAADSNAARVAVNKLVAGLAAAKNDSLFVVNNNGTFEDTYKAKSALPANVADSLMSRPVGSVVGPYLNNGVYSIAKILDRKSLPDSVRARHILIKGATPDAKKKIDSLQALLTTGRFRFDSLAMRNSQDGGSAIKGGDLGWFAQGMMVPEFNATCFYKAEQGKYYTVATQFGWHLIEVTGKKFIKNETSVKAAYLSERVVPGKETQQAVKDKALALLQKSKNLEDLNKTTGEQSIALQPSTPLKANDFSLGLLGSGDDIREIVRWAFNEKTKSGSISKEVFAIRDQSGGFFDSKYVIAGLQSVAPKGKITVAAAKSMNEIGVKVRNIKKAEALKKQISNAGDINAIAQQFGAKVDTARAATITMNIGEPRVLGAVFGTAKGAVSQPVIGNNGLYYVMPVSDRPELQVPADLTMFRRSAGAFAVSTVRNGLIDAMRKAADLQDNRSRFY
jgi:peptidyl-prolyl cis-trans isomerase D